MLLLLLLLLLHLITHPTKCYTNSKVRASSEKTNSEQVRLQVFRKSRWTNCQVPQLDRQLIPTAGTSNSKGSQTPIRPVAGHNKIPTNSGSQSRPTRDCQRLLYDNHISCGQTGRLFSGPAGICYWSKPHLNRCSSWTLLQSISVRNIALIHQRQARNNSSWWDLVKSMFKNTEQLFINLLWHHSPNISMCQLNHSS